MITTIIISLIAILFAWSARFQKTKYGLEIAFITITAFMSIRYNFGNDYSAYLEMFLKVGSDINIDITSESTELGWLFLNKIFQPIGFFGMVIVLTVFEYTVIYRLIKKYVPKNWYWLSVFIFTFSTSFMLIGASMMRQFLAMCITIIAVEFIVKKRWIISILIVILASLFHTSALIFLPLCFLGYLDISFSKGGAIIFFGVYLIFYLLASIVLRDFIINLLGLGQLNRYEIYLNAGIEEKSFGLGVLFNMIMFLFLLFHQKYQSKNMKIIFLLFSFYFLFYSVVDIAPLISRVAFYFSILSIICYPLMFKFMSNKLIKYSLMMGYILLTIIIFTSFFNKTGIWHEHFYKYQTIFSATSWM